MLVRNKDIKIEGSLGGETVNMTLDAKAAVHFMSMLSDIYSDVKTAIVRELSTNAIDAQIEAGVSTPIEITTPTAMSPKLIIRDYGVGMDAEDIRNTYSKYGASTKRNSNDFNGVLGIGAKSPLAYGGKTFTVVGVKNKVKTSVVVGYDPSAGGTMEIVDQSTTNDPNGVTITVPVNDRSDHYDFDQAAKNFQEYAQFRVKVNGREAAKDGTWLGWNENDQRWLFRTIPRGYGGYNTPDVFVMGNVAYRIMPEGRPQQLDLHDQVVIYVDMGEVDFTPSREDLNYNSYTLAAIEKYSKLYIEEKIKGHQSSIDQCKTYAEAYKLREVYRNGFRPALRHYVNFTYKGEEIPTSFGMVGRNVCVYKEPEPKVWSLDTGSNGLEFDPSDNKKLTILNYPNKTFTKVHVAKIHKYCEDNIIGFVNSLRVISTHDNDKLKWFSNETILDWDAIKTVKVVLPKTNPKAKTDKPWEGTGGEKKGKMAWFVPDTSKNIWYTNRTNFGTGRYFDTSDFIMTGTDNDQVFLVIDSLKEKFLKLYPKARPIKELYYKLIKDYIRSVTPEEKLALSRYSQYDRINIPVSPDKILDPLLREAMAGADAEQYYKRFQFAQDLINKLPYGERMTYKSQLPPVGTVTSNVRERYPLIPRYYSSSDKKQVDHVVVYVNAAYQKLINKGV